MLQQRFATQVSKGKCVIHAPFRVLPWTTVDDLPATKDLRKLATAAKFDLFVSELLGSFGDNGTSCVCFDLVWVFSVQWVG